jgi:hypothetical protein
MAVRVLNPGDKPIDGVLLDETPHRNKKVNYVNGNSYDIGGIVESVELLMAPAVRIENLYVRPDWKTGNIYGSIAEFAGKSPPVAMNQGK